MKKIYKRISAIVIALSVFMGSSLLTFAVVCPGSMDGVHHFDSHQRVGIEYEESCGTHSYVYGYDADHNPIYRDGCEITYVYTRCQYKCNHCATPLPDTHTHLIGTKHSVIHP